MDDAPKPPVPARARPARQPFRSKFGGLVVLLVAALLVGAAVYWVDDAFAVESFGRFDILVLGFFALATVFCVDIGRKMLAPSAEAVLARDTRHPGVYLRPFVEDSRRIHTYPVGRRVGGTTIARSSAPASQEQRIAAALKHVGPFIAVGTPGDSLAPLGAARLYLADDAWQQRVEALVRGAAAIVLLPEATEGTRWEVTKVARWVDPRRVLIIVPNPELRPLGYARIQALTAETLPIPLPSDCGKADAFMFDANGQPQPIVFEGRAKAALGPFAEQVLRLGMAQAESA